MKYANGTVLNLSLDADWGLGLGCIFVGEKGRIEINRDKISADPKELLDAPGNPGHLQLPETQPHIEDWVRCIKTRERCTADIDTASAVRRFATWSTSPATWAGSANRSTGTRKPSDSPTAMKATRC